MLSRRSLLAMIAVIGARPSIARAEGTRLAPWRPGLLDIHHIDTGRGNATFILAPDGTTLLIDCGEVAPGAAVLPLRPDESRRAGEWVARYALRQARAAGRDTIDYAIATHIHPDHVGDPGLRVPVAGEPFVRTGLSDVDALMPIDTVIDRGFPDYGEHPPPAAPFASNHRAWLDERVGSGRKVVAALAGSSRQIVPRHDADAWRARIVAANGRIWSGDGDTSDARFPPQGRRNGAATPNENMCSIALRLDHGQFRYFTGGDLTADTQDGAYPWMDVETPAALATGPVSVAAANHHGYFDAVGRQAARALSPTAWIIQSWHATHPAPAQLQRMEQAWPGRARREVYATRLQPSARAVNDRFVADLAGEGGHIVVRATADGRFTICCVSSEDESDRLIAPPRDF